MSGSLGGGVGVPGTGGVDSSIPLQAGRGSGGGAQNPLLSDPLGTMGKLNQLQLFPLQLQQHQQELELQRLGITGKGIENQRAGVGLSADQAALTQRLNDITANGMSSLALDPEATTATVQARLGQLQHSGVNVDGLTKGFAESGASSPAEINAYWRQQFLMTHPDLAVPKLTPRDIGGKIVYVDENPYTNQGLAGTELQRTQTISEKMTPQAVMGPGNVPGTVPQGEKYDEHGNLRPEFGGSPANATPGGGGSSGTAGTPRGFTPTGLSADQLKFNEESAGAAHTAQVRAGQFATDMFPLQRAQEALEKAPTGKGSDAAHYVSSLLTTYSPEWAQKGLSFLSAGVVMTPAEVAAYDEAKKYMTQVALGVPGSTRSDVGQATGAAASPSPQISKEAAQMVLRGMIGLRRMEQAGTVEFNATGKPPSDFTKFMTQFSTRADPRVFVFDQMSPAQRRETLSGLKDPAKRQAFMDAVDRAETNGIMAAPQ